MNIKESEKNVKRGNYLNQWIKNLEAVGYLRISREHPDYSPVKIG